MSESKGAIERVFREESGRILATLIRILGDFDHAEEALQDAFTKAVERWSADGIPDQPAAWITTAARNRAVDFLRREQRRGDRSLGDPEHAGGRDSGGEDMGELFDSSLADDRLRLVFTCCHPALARDAQVALTLRTLGGLSTNEIARAFLVPTATLAQRLVRAKRKIKEARIPYRVPPDHLLPERVPSVLAVIYLIFNEGYAASTGDALIRRDLCEESIRLARLMTELMPDEPEALGILALMMLHDSRRHARIDAAGDPVLLEDQDRSVWDHAEATQARATLDRALRFGRRGSYQIQAAIAALHADAATAADTDWPQIVQLYGALLALGESPIVQLNRAVAVAMADGPEAGLTLVNALGSHPALHSYHYYHSTRAELLRRLQRPAEAARSYEIALKYVQNDREARFLTKRMAECRHQTDSGTASAQLAPPPD